MSIFESKEFWSTTIGNKEEFDSNSIYCGNIDNEVPSKVKIAVSSFSGNFRIYEPTFGDYKLENLQYEKSFNEPIIQISMGNMIINSSDKQLILLHSKRLLVLQFYSLRANASSKVCFEHKLPRTAYNFCLGKIGDKNYDVLFVQSVDGVISIIEQESIVNSVELYEMVLPGCIAYIDRKDYFVISNTSYEIECYTYNSIATCKPSNTDKSKKLNSSWNVNIGELVKEIKVINNIISKKQELYIISETMVFLLSGDGQIIFQKKLDLEVMAANIYNIEDTSYVASKTINFMQLICTTDHVMVYKGQNLAWALK